MTWRERVLRWLRVPYEPAAPAGDEDVRVFRAAPNYLRYRILRWAVTNAGAAVGVIFALRFTASIMEPTRRVLQESIGYEHIAVAAIMLLEAGAVVGFLAQAVGSLLLLKIDVEQRWYMVSDRSIRIREGLVRLHEKTMTLANVQHVSVRQGPVQRLLGIADVEIRSAGGGEKREPGDREADLHVAWFRGVGNAGEIRDAVRDRLRTHRDAGLGDPDDEPAHGSAWAPAALTAAQELAHEARLLQGLRLPASQ